MRNLQARLRVGHWPADTLVVEKVEASEHLNDLFEIDVQVWSAEEPSVIATLVGDAVRLTWSYGDRQRTWHGIVRSVRTKRRHRTDRKAGWSYGLQLAPRAWLATLNEASRVFEEQRADQVIAKLLGIYSIPTRFHLRRPLPIRPYTTQYEESDWQVVQRLAGSHGLSFYFEQPTSDTDGVLDVPQQVAAHLASVASAAVGEASSALDPLTLAGPVREVLVFIDDASGYAETGAQRPWELVTGIAGAATQALSGVDDRAAAAAGVVGRAVGEVTDALDRPDVVHFRPPGGALHSDEPDSMRRFEERLAVTAERAVYRHYDPRRPDNGVQAFAGAQEVATNIARALARGDGELGALEGQIASELTRGEQEVLHHVDRPLERYAHHPQQPDPDHAFATSEPDRMLRHARRDRRVAEGESVFPWLSAGHRFTLVGHEYEALDGQWTVTEVTHHIDVNGSEREEDVYFSELSCVPADVLHPASPPQRRVVHAIQTARVVGGSDIATNERGQIRVRFHWDRDEHQTCWLRVMQPWSGAGFGAQFIPRVGTEVVVGFERGDPDLPLVMGTLYDGTHPLPFSLPEERTRSGFRTQSSPGNDAAARNELSFEDAAGAEEVFLRAQRDLREEVVRDRETEIGHDARSVIGGERHLDVRGDTEETHHQARSVTVMGHQRTRIEGGRSEVTRGGYGARCEGDYATEVDGVERRQVSGNSSSQVRGNAVHRVGGSHVLVVGSSDAKRTAATHVHGDLRSSASETIELRAEGTLVLRCGSSALVMTPDAIELEADDVRVNAQGVRVSMGSGQFLVTTDELVQALAPEVVLQGDGAGVTLTSEAAIDGSRVLLNSPSEASDPASSEEDELTVIELVDQHGQPIPHHPYRILLGDGSERSGVLDGQGTAEIRLDASAEVVFPGLPEVDPA